MTANLTGRKLSNRYLIGERIGIGGMAEVYQGQDSVLGRTVAVKVMLPQFAEDPTFTARFRQEAASAANLQSPYIVNVYDWGQDHDTSYIVMEFVRGSDLKTAIQQRGAINQRKVAEIGSQVCQALAVAHNLDIIHRDIKPQNIMVQPDGNVKVMDFGIARAKNSVKAKTSAVLGTAHYISPEQAQGKELTAASDIYSLGIVLYEAATGELPFDGPDAVSVALKQVKEEPKPPREVNPAIDADLEAIIMKAMSKDPRGRFATARDMRHALNDYLAGRKISGLGFNNADTALITDAMPDIPPVGPFQTDQTAVMAVQDGQSSLPTNNRVRTYVDNTDDAKKRPPSRRGLFIGIGVAIAALIAVGAAFAVFGGGAGNGNEVPDVTGKTVGEATSLISDAGFVVGATEYVFSDSVPADSIVEQSPRGGTKQAEGTKINLTISQGIEQVAVPDLTNMTASEARSALQKVGLKYEAGTAEHSDKIKENHVMRQSPQAGEKVEKGATVTYYLSAGEETIAVPDVVGQLEGAAQSTLGNAGFKVTVDHASDSNVPEGAVISQNPKAGEKVKSGTSVSIVVSTGVKYYAVSAYVSNSNAGEVSPGSTNVAEGGSVTFYITPYDGYKISAVSDSNGKSYGTSSSVTISDVKGDVSLSVEFAADSSKKQDNTSNNTSNSSNNDSSQKSNKENNTSTKDNNSASNGSASGDSSKKKSS